MVADLTGSMYPYAQQISTWLKLQFLKDTTSQHFVFFNDGDNKKDADKKAQTAKVNAPKSNEVMTADQVKNEVEKKVADTNKGTQNVNMNVKHEVQVPAVMDALQREIVKDQSLFASWAF